MYYLLAGVVLYSAAGVTYYKVPIPKGVRIVKGVVADTCKKVGLSNVCSGPAGCEFDVPRCLLTPLSSQCGNHMYPLSIVLCNGRTPQKCDATEGMFSAVKSWQNGAECGAVNGKWCTTSKQFTSGYPKIYFAYCANY